MKRHRAGHKRALNRILRGLAQKVAKLWQVIRERFLNDLNRQPIGSGTRFASGMARTCNPVIRSHVLRGAVTRTELFGERASIGKS
jgi:hypothetical protein